MVSFDLYLVYKLGILTICTEPWNDTSYVSTAWYRCQASKAKWSINELLIVSLTRFNYLNLTLNLIITHIHAREQINTEERSIYTVVYSLFLMLYMGKSTRDHHWMMHLSLWHAGHTFNSANFLFQEMPSSATVESSLPSSQEED